jgi:hypothetical protein
MLVKYSGLSMSEVKEVFPLFEEEDQETISLEAREIVNMLPSDSLSIEANEDLALLYYSAGYIARSTPLV